MCNVHSHGHAHGVRTDAEKAVADLRDDLVEELKIINKYEAQIPVIAGEDFTDVDEVVKSLIQMRDDHKGLAARLVKLITKVDTFQAGLFDLETPSEEHADHDHH